MLAAGPDVEAWNKAGIVTNPSLSLSQAILPTVISW